jgi:putative nucleotidyltransferase with HDIG domain
VNLEFPLQIIATRSDEQAVAASANKVVDPQGFILRIMEIIKHMVEKSHDEITLKDGRVFERYSAPMTHPFESDHYLGRVWYFHDITERERAKRALERTNRALRTLSSGNEVLVRAASESDLLHEMCRVIVEAGGYRIAWIGEAEQDEAKTVTPVAWAGAESGFLSRTRCSWADVPTGRGPSGRAIRTGEPQTSQNLAEDPLMEPWLAEAQKRGFASAGSLPLKDGLRVFGVLTIYAAEPDAFDADELKLLLELATDLSYGIRALRDRVARESAEQRWRTTLEATIGAIASTVEMRDPYTAGHQKRVAELAAAIAREIGLPKEEVHGIYLAGIIHDVGKITVPAEILSKPGKLSPLEYRLIQAHAQSGHDIVRGVDFPWPIAEMILQHHERLDGSGYPNALTRFIHRGFETAVPQRVGNAVFGGVGDAAFGV